MTAVQLIRKVLPPTVIEIREGRVVKYRKWTLWSGVPWETVYIERTDDGFRCSVHDLEHGSTTVVGSLDLVAAQFDNDIGAQYRELFMFDEPTGAQLRPYL